MSGSDLENKVVASVENVSLANDPNETILLNKSALNQEEFTANNSTFVNETFETPPQDVIQESFVPSHEESFSSDKNQTMVLTIPSVNDTFENAQESCSPVYSTDDSTCSDCSKNKTVIVNKLLANISLNSSSTVQTCTNSPNLDNGFNEIVSLVNKSSEAENSVEDVFVPAQEFFEVKKLRELAVTNARPRPSLLALFDPLHETINLNEETDIEHIKTIHKFACEIVNNLVDSAVNKLEDSEFCKNNPKPNVKTDMAGLNTKIESYEEEESSNFKVQPQASQDIVNLEKRLQTQENELLAKEQVIQQLKSELLECKTSATNESPKDDISKIMLELKTAKSDAQNSRKIVHEYETLVAEQFSKLQKLNEEHNTVTQHLANLELAFSDLLKKYERCKEIISGFKCNEDVLREALAESKDEVANNEQKYESLKSHAKAQLERANQELQLLREQRDNDLAKSTAVIKRLEIKNNSLADSLEQKTKECAAIAALFDEVTGKV